MIDLSAKRVVGPAIRLNSNDNIVVARMPIEPGTEIPAEGVTVREKIPQAYKIATRRIAQGEEIRKYDTVVGFAATEIEPGSLVHSHNTVFRDFERDYAYASEYRPIELVPEAQQATFQGYVRPDGRVGTRNYVGIFSTVNCSATVVHEVAEHFRRGGLEDFPNVDGVVAFSHALGCGMEMTGEPMDLLRRTMAGYIRHPNIGAAIVVGLGCERNLINLLLAEQGLAVGPNLRTFEMQETGGTRRTIQAGVDAVKAMLPEVNDVRRVTVPASKLVLALQCGGSDGFSSITANPSLGVAVDILARQGGAAILSETPEVYGVEHTLTRRACSREVGEKLIERIRWWKEEYNKGRDTQINGVVSPGNQMGGLANIFEKALGSAMKGGTGPLMEVYRYAEQVRAKGLVFMDTPGFDPVAATGQIAGGANVLAFTTGRGSMFGSVPTPSMKLATNTAMYRRLEEDMDINCGEVADGSLTIQEMGQRIFDLMLRTASGEQTKSELLGVGRHEFAPWQIGVMS